MKHVRRKSKVSDARIILVGLVGPKSRAEAVDDGERVNIPVPREDDKSEEGTQEGRPACYWIQVLNL